MNAAPEVMIIFFIMIFASYGIVRLVNKASNFETAVNSQIEYRQELEQENNRLKAQMYNDMHEANELIKWKDEQLNREIKEAYFKKFNRFNFKEWKFYSPYQKLLDSNAKQVEAMLSHLSQTEVNEMYYAAKLGKKLISK